MAKKFKSMIVPMGLDVCVEDLAHAIGYAVQQEEWSEEAISTAEHAEMLLNDYYNAGKPGYGDNNEPTESQKQLAERLFLKLEAKLNKEKHVRPKKEKARR